MSSSPHPLHRKTIVAVTKRSTAKIVAEYLECALQKDPAAVDRFFHPDIEYVVDGSPLPHRDQTIPPISAECIAAVPWAGYYRGKSAVKRFLRQQHEQLDITAHGVRQVISQGNRAAVFGWFRLRSRSTDRTADIAYAIFLEMRDGLIAKYHSIENTFEVANALRPNPLATSPLSIQRFTSAEAGAWSNAYLICGSTNAILFDVPMLRSDALRLAEEITRSGKNLNAVFVSHAHPDHFMGLDVITGKFPWARVVATRNVVADIRDDGPWMLSLLQQKLGPEGPGKLVIPEVFSNSVLPLEDSLIEIVEFGTGESRHIATLFIPDLGALLAADLIYHQAHCHLQEKHLDEWLARLDELERFSRGRVTTLYPGHGPAGDLSLIDHTRTYLRDFRAALEGGASAKTVEAKMLEKYPLHHARPSLTAFTLPAYFPAPKS
jgi:glyoxylase-like metal-dependent hydrolase (beta-lactamase superfamily II)/ketosteroid isomerase-like protein